MKKIIFSLPLALAALTGTIRAQLAITELMSSAANTYTQNGVTNAVTQNSDFWELSNFGSETIDLSGYKMADEGAGFAGAYSAPFDGLIIAPGESILFVQDSVDMTEQEVRDWWGPGLSNNVRIVFYHNYGLSGSGDGISLWDASDNLVDRAHIDAATPGISFTYDTVTGAIGILSTNGEKGAFKAASTDDVGSPGVTAGPVPLLITLQPTNMTVVSGSSATFVSAAQGLPHPKYLWTHSGIPIVGATSASFAILNALTNDAGIYAVIITNGLQTVASSNVILTVNAAATAPSVLTSPADLVAYAGQSATFTVQAQGNPSPTFQWKRNGSILPGETTNTLFRSGLATNDSGVYSVVISNSAGIANASANLLVTPKPFLAITEVQSSESSGPAASADWWELSNLDSFDVDLFGYRWDDNSANLGVAYTVTNHVVVHPGESVIFVETSAPGVMTGDKFKAWWGETNLPSGLQIIVYGGNGLGLSATSDQVNLWNQATTVETDPIGKVAAAQLSTSAAGRTFVRNPDNGIFSGNSTTGLSTNGINGGFVSSMNADVGSPGWYVEPLRLQISANGNARELSWKSVSGRAYTVFYKDDLTAASWVSLSNVVAASSLTAITDEYATSSRIYRLAVTVQ